MGWETGNPALGGHEGEQRTFLPMEAMVMGLEGIPPSGKTVGHRTD